MEQDVRKMTARELWLEHSSLVRRITQWAESDFVFPLALRDRLTLVEAELKKLRQL